MEKKIKKQYLLLLFMFANISYFSHPLFAQQPLEPAIPLDSVRELVFQDKNQIIEWFKAYYYYVGTEELFLKEHHIFILRIDRCSGISCPFFYVFKEKQEQWIFITGLSMRFYGGIYVKIDDSEEKLIFLGSSSQLVTDKKNIEGKDVYGRKTGKEKKKIFERIYRKLEEIPIEMFLDSE